MDGVGHQEELGRSRSNTPGWISPAPMPCPHCSPARSTRLRDRARRRSAAGGSAARSLRRSAAAGRCSLLAWRRQVGGPARREPWTLPRLGAAMARSGRRRIGTPKSPTALPREAEIQQLNLDARRRKARPGSLRGLTPPTGRVAQSPPRWHPGESWSASVPGGERLNACRDRPATLPRARAHRPAQCARVDPDPRRAPRRRLPLRTRKMPAKSVGIAAARSSHEIVQSRRPAPCPAPRGSVSGAFAVFSQSAIRTSQGAQVVQFGGFSN